MYFRPWICKHAWARFNRRQSVQAQAQDPKPMGDHSYKLWYILTATLLTLYFQLTSDKNPCFYQKLSPKVQFFFTSSKILEMFHSKTSNGLEFEKKVPKCPLFLWLLSLKYPLYFCLACTWLREMLLCQTQSEFRKFCILETESWNLVNTFRYKSNKGVKTKFQFYRLNWPIIHYGWNSLEGRDRPSTPPPHWSNTEEDMYPTITLCMILHILAL